MSRRPECPALIALVLVAGLFCLDVPARAELPERVLFNRHVRPILSDKCYACHGPDEEGREADLRLDTPEGLLAELDGHRVVVPEKPDESELIARITTDSKRKRMPPRASKKVLTERDVEILRRWIEQGAQFQRRWSLAPLVRPETPQSAGEESRGNPIDSFLRRRLREEGLEFSPRADRRTLIRRLYFDLTGLPPSPDEVEAFETTEDPEFWEKLVDNLLASSAHGERLAVFWLDMVRYADTNGIHGDNHREHTLYRDWVISALTENMRFDHFTVEQLAGDLLENPTREQRIASGYNRLLMTTREGGAQPKEYLAKYAADRVRNASTVWMASTLGCAECHDHKFDPFSTRDFYSFASFFADLKETPVGVQAPSPFPTPEQEEAIARIDEQIAEIRRARDALEGDGPRTEERREAESQRIKALEGERKKIRDSAPKTLISLTMEPRTMRVLPRGNWLDDSGEVVTPAIPAALGKLEPSEARATRLDLARWLVSERNPLTARVFVNRLWKLCFGHGIVRSLDDFGSQGTPPSHPELLDWLAAEFVDSGWNIRHILRLMVSSQTYMQSSLTPASLRERDPYNSLFARQSRYRLDAEMVRDNALAVSGLLDRSVGGPSAKPYQPSGYWAHLNFPTRQYKADSGRGLYRRGLYTYWCRTFLHPSLLAFDAPTREECTVERVRSNTPLQALVLLNDPSYVEAARVLASRLLEGPAASDVQRVTRLFREVLAREPLDAERAILAELLEAHREEYRADPEAASRLLEVGEATTAVDDVAELAAWTSVVRVVLNLHETITRS